MGILDWFKKQTLEGKIHQCIGTVSGVERAYSSTTLSVDVLESGSEGPARIRLGFEFKGPLSYESQGVILTPEAARQLSTLLKSASS